MANVDGGTMLEAGDLSIVIFYEEHLVLLGRVRAQQHCDMNAPKA